MTCPGLILRSLLVAAFVGVHYGVLVNKWLGVAVTAGGFFVAYDGMKRSPA